MGEYDPAAPAELASEAIVVLDLIESTATSTLFGWHAVGRGMMHELRALASDVGAGRGLRCIKSTGDGYLLAFGDPRSAETAGVNAVESAFALLTRVAARNGVVPEERAIHLRFGVHLGR